MENWKDIFGDDFDPLEDMSEEEAEKFLLGLLAPEDRPFIGLTRDVSAAAKAEQINTICERIAERTKNAGTGKIRYVTIKINEHERHAGARLIIPAPGAMRGKEQRALFAGLAFLADNIVYAVDEHGNILLSVYAENVWAEAEPEE